jgi:hypothetical protein
LINTDNPNFILYTPTAPLASHRLRNVFFSHTSHFTGRLIMELYFFKKYIFLSLVFYCVLHFHRSRVCSGSILSDYGLDNRAIGVRSPAGTKDFSSSLCVQTGSGAHPASCTMGTGDTFPGGKARPGGDADHSPPSSAEVVNE